MGLVSLYLNAASRLGRSGDGRCALMGKRKKIQI